MNEPAFFPVKVSRHSLGYTIKKRKKKKENLTLEYRVRFTSQKKRFNKIYSQ